MPAPKFNFIPEKQLNENVGSGHWTVSIIGTRATPAIYFSKEMVDVLEMDGKYIRVFGDPGKKSIGWQVIRDETSFSDLSEARKVNKNKENGSMILTIGKVLKGINYTLDGTIKGLVVQTHSSPLIKGDISYISLPDREVGVVESRGEENHTDKKE